MQDQQPKRVLIAIGLTSGLGSIAYSVVVSTPSPKVLNWEVMPGPRAKRQVPHQRRYHAHRLMFEAIFDRWPPAIIGLGPPSSTDEPIEWVTFMRVGVFEMGKSLGIPVVLFDTNDHLVRGLNNGMGGPGLKTLVKQHLPRFRSNKRRVILATATAMAGAEHIRRRQEESL